MAGIRFSVGTSQGESVLTSGSCRRIAMTLLAFVLLVSTTGSVATASAVWDSLREEREYRSAVGLLKSKDYELARRQYESFLDQFPTSERRHRAYFGLAETHYLQDRYDSAAELYREALAGLESTEDYVLPALNRGLHSLNESRRLDLLEKYMNYVEQHEDNLSDEIRRRVVRTLDRAGRVEEAHRRARKYFGEDTGSPHWRYQVGILSAEQNQVDTAIQYLRPLLETDGKYQNDARYTLAELYYERGEHERAGEYYQTLLMDEQYKHRARYGLAWVDLKKDNMDRARDRLRTLAEGQNSVRVQAARDLARIHRSEGNTQKASDWYEKSIQWAEGSARSKLRLEFGNYLVETDRLTEAIPYFEEAGSLQNEARRSLIRAYLVDGQYEEGVKRLRELRSEGQLAEPIWSVRLATGLYYLGQFEQALDELPDDVSTEDPQVRKRFLYLKGSLNYRIKNWSEAEKAYESASAEFPGWEPKYFGALIEEKQGNRSKARERLQSLRKTGPPEPWKSRISYQLARFAFFDEDNERLRKYADEIDPDEFEAPMQFEYNILQFADRLRQNPGDVSPEGARSLLESADQFNQEVRWYDYLTVTPLGAEWWDEALLPALKDQEELRSRRSVQAIADLRRSGHYDRAFQLARTYYEDAEPSRQRRRILNQLFNILRDRGTPREIGTYLPDRSEWSQWSEIDPKPLALALSEFYHVKDRPEDGLEAIRHLRSVLGDVSSTVGLFLDEAEAGFLVRLGDYETARNLLEGIPREQRSRSGNINRAIVRYHLGDPTASFSRLEDIGNSMDTPPVALYDYVFRYLRNSRQNDGLRNWTDRMIDRHDYRDTDVRSLVVKNLRFWVNNDDSTGALEVIDRLNPRARTIEERAPLQYFRGLGFFNRRNLDQALNELTSLRESADLPSPWKERTLHYEVEIHLRQGSWQKAYRRWQELNDIGGGGRSGRRLLTGSGLETSPDRFETLLDEMSDTHSEYINPGDTYYWRGRLAEARNQYNLAIREYQQYFEEEYDEHRVSAGVRLAGLYDRLTDHQQAREVYDSLYEETDEAVYQIRQATQLRKLNEYDRAETLLQTVLEKDVELRGEAHYELGYVHLGQRNLEAARDHFRQALEVEDGDKNWRMDARKRFVELSLNRGDREAAKREIQKLESELLRSLYRAELQRQSGNLSRAVEVIEERKNEYPQMDNDQRSQYREVASLVYFENGQHEDLLKLHDTVPRAPTNQMLYVRSLLELDRAEDVEDILDRLAESNRNEAQRRLASYYFEHENWERAATLYDGLPGTSENRSRRAEALVQLERYEEAFSTWEEALEQFEERSEPDSGLITEIVRAILTTGRDSERPEPSVDLLDEYWDLPFRERKRFAAEGLIGSVQIGNEPMMDRFLNRLDGIALDRFVTVAEELERREDWNRLNQLLQVADKHSGTHRYGYFEGVLGLNNVRDYSDFSTKLNEVLNEAIQEESDYAPRLQRLLGDFYYDREQYQRAAIEYRKIELLFEDGQMSHRTRSRLARSYDRIGDTEKARNHYRQLTGDTVPRSLQKEARRWLDSNVDGSS